MDGVMAMLPVLLAGVAAFCVVVYVLADGFDLGVGILFLFAPRDTDRDIMMASIEPTWDGNETWLVMGGTVLLAAFPAGYYILLPAVYLPVSFMLVALVLRGVAFEFRAKSGPLRRIWDWVFAIGSALATLCQGLILGQLIAGVTVKDGMFAGGTFDFVSIIGLLGSAGLIGGYALLGAGWLIWRTSGPTQVFGREIARAALILVAATLVLVSLWSVLFIPEIATRWLAWPGILFLVPIPLITAAVIWRIWTRLWTGPDHGTFALTVVLFLLGFVGLVVGIWPYVVPRHVTIWDGLADPQSVAFIAVGLVIVLPIVLAYQLQAYRVFRGKVDHAGGYEAD